MDLALRILTQHFVLINPKHWVIVITKHANRIEDE